MHDFPFIHTAAVEVTSKCNLRCTYCMVSQPDYVGLDMTEAMLAEILRELRNRQVDQLCINGHGETTMISGWQRPFEPYVDEFQLSLTSNFARPFTAEELGFLARLASINVSLDTANPTHLRQIRRAVKLSVITQNVIDVRSTALRKNLPSPRFVLYAGVYDQSVMHLEELVSFAITLGFSHVIFWSLVKHADVADGINVQHLATLNEREKREAVGAIESAVALLDHHNVSYEFVGDFFEVFKRQLAAETTPVLASEPPPIPEPSPLPETAPPPPNRIFEVAKIGVTRDCFAPWYYSQIKADGTVYPCCTHSPLDRVSETTRYADILAGSPLKRLRQNLLTGELDNECRNCHMKALIPLEDYQAKYETVFNLSLEQPGAIAVPPWRRPADPSPPPLPTPASPPFRSRLLRKLRSLMRRWLFHGAASRS